MNTHPNPPTHRPFTSLVVLAVCAIMCLPTAVTVARGGQGTQTPTTLTYTYLFKAPVLSALQLGSQVYTQLHMSGAMNLGKDVGGPSIPVSFVKLALPPMTTFPVNRRTAEARMEATKV